MQKKSKEKEKQIKIKFCQDAQLKAGSCKEMRSQWNEWGYYEYCSRVPRANLIYVN
jgi:hypothetical protein